MAALVEIYPCQRKQSVTKMQTCKLTPWNGPAHLFPRTAANNVVVDPDLQHPVDIQDLSSPYK